MQPTFYYLVKAKLIRFQNANDISFMEINECFKNENPILAREASFNFYQNWIDVLLQRNGLIYESDKHARQNLNNFIIEKRRVGQIKIKPDETKSIESVKIENDSFELMLKNLKLIEVEIPADIDNRIEIFFVVDIPNKAQEELLIHGIGNFNADYYYPTDSIICNLQEEYDLYKQYSFDTNNQDKTVIYCSSDEWEEGYRENEPATYTILETPFDWSGYDVPYWWGEPNNESFEEIIAGGEGNQVEFKPSLLYNFKTGKAGIGIKQIIAKTICAFLNSNGGLLFIGVDDNGQIQGIDYDFSLANGKNHRDFFQLEFDQMLEHFLGFGINSLVTGKFDNKNENEKTIFIVMVEPCKNRPIFLKVQDNSKEFWIRGNASNRQLNDIEDMLNYMLDRQKK